MLARFASLPPRERRIVLAAALLLPAARVAVAVAGLRYIVRAIEGLKPALAPDNTAAAGRVGVLVHATADCLPLAFSCLDRSLVVSWMLRRAGERCALVIESAPHAASFEAHAWVHTAHGAIGDPAPEAVEIARWSFGAS